MIPKETISLILDATRIEEVIGDFVPLKKSGSSYKGLSPFVQEKTPSFYVVPAKGIFKDFSSGKGGSALTFLMEHEKISYPDALRYLARKYNIQIEEEELSPEQILRDNERESLFLLLKFAQEYFSSYMLESDEGRSVGLGYFKERGFSDLTINKFSLGYHPEGRDNFTKLALDKGYRLEFLEKLGLSKQRDGRAFDFFHGRVMFPIHNLTGRVIGFGGRVLRTDNKAIAKYFNSPESELYNKSKTLYGLYQSKGKIVSEDRCLLVEGYTDVLAMHQAGIENVVSSSGTSLTLDQIQLIKRYTVNVTILYDGDAAGIRASFRGIDMLLEAGMHIKVLLFPDGDDPDSYAKKVSGSELKEYIDNQSQDFIAFKANILLKDAGNDPIKRADIIKDIVHSIALVPEGILRSTYIKHTSHIMDMQEQVLLNELNVYRSKSLKKEARANNDYQDIPVEEYVPQQQAPLEELDDVPVYERELLRLMINYGERNFELHDIDPETNKSYSQTQNVSEIIIETLTADEIKFIDPTHECIYNLLCTEEYRTEPSKISQHPDIAIANFAANMLANTHQISEGWADKQFIETKTEDKNLERTVFNAIFAFLLKSVEKEIKAIREEIKTCAPDDEFSIIALMQKQMELETVKGFYSKKLERVILK